LGRARSVLEPGCGSGRYLEALARHGLEVVGIDSSAPMIDLARSRLTGASLAGEAVLGDMTAFALGRRFDGAVCAIATLQHLAPAELERHLACMARHLANDARYMVQLALYDPGRRHDFPASSWEVSQGDLSLRIDWTTEQVNVDAGRARQHSRIEILSGPRRGEVVEENHEMTAWTPETWSRALADSRFSLAALYDGSADPSREVDPGTPGGLIWSELALSEASSTARQGRRYRRPLGGR
jgi:cyclopropane fatty-acyl-phospholipid synthase-like methyltransferase